MDRTLTLDRINVLFQGGPKHGQLVAEQYPPGQVIFITRGTPLLLQAFYDDPAVATASIYVHRDRYEFSHRSDEHTYVYRYEKEPCGDICGWCEHPCSAAPRHSHNWYEDKGICWFCGDAHPECETIIYDDTLDEDDDDVLRR